MKKAFALLLSGMMMCSMAACGQGQTDTGSQASSGAETTAAVQESTAGEESKAKDILAGGYTDVEDPTVTDDIKALFDKATEGLAGVGYEPVAYIGSQVVAGTNHLLLCKATPVTANPVTTYALVVLYEDLDGNAEIANVVNSTANAPAAQDPENPMSGAYADSESPKVTDEAKQALTKASEALAGASYEPKALLATQVVAGTNYMLLCKATPTVPDAKSSYSIVTVYADLDGNAEITQTVDFASDEESPAEIQAETSNG